METTTEHNICGDCLHFRRFTGMPRGECGFNPPAVFHTGHQLRPKVRVEEIACGHWDQASKQLEKAKVLPDTPGQAAKDRRKKKK